MKRRVGREKYFSSFASVSDAVERIAEGALSAMADDLGTDWIGEKGVNPNEDSRLTFHTFSFHNDSYWLWPRYRWQQVQAD